MAGLLFVILGFAVFLTILTLVFQWRMRHHQGVSREEFVREFEGSGVPPVIPTTVYDYYKRSVIFRGFGVGPADRLESVFHRGEKDVDDDAQFLMKRLGFRKPLRSATPCFDKPIQTLRDMVLWLDWVRQHQNDLA